MKYEYCNDFHNTVAISTLSAQDIEAIEYDQYRGVADKNMLRKLKRLEEKLCGMSDCKCGGFWKSKSL